MILGNCSIFDGERFREGLNDIYINNDRIIDIRKSTHHNDAIDIKGCFAVPGFIDIHTHGICGMDFSYSTEFDINSYFDCYVKNGTTSVYPTTVAMDYNRIYKLLSHYYNIKHPAFCGIHLEGPFLNINKSGAHKKEFILKPSIEAYIKMTGEYETLVKRVTIACELDYDYLLAAYLIKNKKIVSFGHTECSAEQAFDAFKAGYRLSTHHFNAMPLMHHRDVSITGAALIDNFVSCEYIPDFHHVSKDMLKILFKCKEPENLIMITDSISATLMPEGKYLLGGLEVNVKNGLVMDASGTIAGSSITMSQGVYNMINNGFDKTTVLKSATSNPAKVMLLKDNGFLNTNYYADINILDQDFNYLFTINKGVRIN
ncbi:MAG: N-acetylglucosamine-6-phosphate deacetylase [Clostridia bacterium]|jgi:N-acetylglucosamine-6-phosphate deacetylase